MVEIKNKINKRIRVEIDEDTNKPLLQLDTISGEQIAEYRMFFFDTEDDFRKWVNKLYKAFGGVSDYIILLAHKYYKDSVNRLDALRLKCNDQVGEIFHVRLELPYCYLIDTYNMKEEEVWERIENLIEKDYLEYGVNIKYAWLTEKGEAYFKELQNG